MYSSNQQNDEKIKEKKEILKDSIESKLSILERGSVTEITLGGRTFQITDPKRIEQTFSVLQHHEESLHLLRQRVKEQSSAINQLINEVTTLKNEVQRLKEITNGYGSQELSNY